MQSSLSQSTEKLSPPGEICWRDSFESFFYEFYSHKAGTCTRVARKLIEYHRDGRSLEVRQFAADCDEPSSTVYRVMNQYGIGRLLFGAASNDSQFGNRSNTLPESHHAQTENTVTGRENTLLPLAEVIENMIRMVVIPRKKIEFDLTLPDELLVEALGSESTTALDEIKTRFEAAAPDYYQAQLEKLVSSVDEWRFNLDDATLTALPDTWKQDYTLAAVEQRFSAVEGKPDSWKAVRSQTSIPRATYARYEKKLGVVRDPVFNPRAQEIDDLADFPRLEYSNQFKGFPRVVVIWEDGRSFKELDYTKNRDKAREALRTGLRVAVKYQQSSIPRRMTEDEKQAKLDVEPRIKRPRKPTISEPRPLRHIGIGYSLHEARRIAIEICERLGDRIVTGHGEIIPLERLKPIELVEVMRGKANEVAKMYTPKEELAAIVVKPISIVPDQIKPAQQADPSGNAPFDDSVIAELIRGGGVIVSIEVNDTGKSRFEQLRDVHYEDMQKAAYA